MPKIHYPFSKTDTGERNYHVSMQLLYVKGLIRAEKWDGTNICAYTYKNEYGMNCIAYKTRLTPILRGESEYGNFRALWNEINPVPTTNVFKDALQAGYHVCFELCGFRNPHLVKYPFPLAAKPLVYIDNHTGKTCFPYGAEIEGDFIALYENARKEAEQINTNEEENLLTEGSVFYLLMTDGGAIPFKCKPESIEKLHWAAGSIEPGAVYTTVVNALENMDYTELTLESVRPLFQEEYTGEQIARSQTRIEKAIAQVIEHVVFVKKVKETAKHFPLLVGIDKGVLMRYMSNHFGRNEMSRVYSALRELGYVT
jgi:hypothetical protein